jgi:hypothetical protein
MEDDGQVSALVCDNGSGMVKVRAVAGRGHSAPSSRHRCCFLAYHGQSYRIARLAVLTLS